jgi:hypothetical protein
MGFTFFHDLPGYIYSFWAWASVQNGGAAFALGAMSWFVLERIFGFVTSPISKVMSVLGFVFVLLFAAAFFVDFAGSYERGTIPFENSTKTPGVDTLRSLE